MSKLSHMDTEGRVAMVDTSAKETTARRAVASARGVMSIETVAAVRAHRTRQGDLRETARLAVVSFALVSTIATRPSASMWESLLICLSFV